MGSTSEPIAQQTPPLRQRPWVQRDSKNDDNDDDDDDDDDADDDLTMTLRLRRQLHEPSRSRQTSPGLQANASGKLHSLTSKSSTVQLLSTWPLFAINGLVVETIHCKAKATTSVQGQDPGHRLGRQVLRPRTRLVGSLQM